MTTEESQPLSFEDALRQLAEIAEGMEQGGLTLAEATARFEQGMKLVRHCNQLLDKAELEITQLKDSYQHPGAPGPGVPGASRDGFQPSAYDYPMDEDEVYEDEESLPF